MSSRLPASLAESIEARLRYYRDLGIYDFYRRGEPAAALLTAPDGVEEAVADVIEAAAADRIVVSERALPEIASEMVTKKREFTDLPSVLHAVEESRAAAPASPEDALRILRAELGECTRCALARGRNKIVFGDGDPKARLF